MKNQIYRIATLFFSLLALPFIANAQIVKGIIQDDEGEVLIGANVVLKETGNNPQTFGASTDEKGAYRIQASKGKYNLEISYIGYTTYTAQIEVKGDVNLPPIQLGENSQQMEAVVITAKTITYNANGYIAEISKNPFYREQDMNSILKLSPGTNTTASSIQVYGQSVSKVYMNGRELRLSGEQLINYLSTLEGKNVKQMEVIAASGVDEDASTMGSSIIKITTINPETGGMLNVGDMSQLFGDEGKYSHSPSMMLNWRLGKKWSTYFNGSAMFTKTSQGNRTETHFYDSDIRLLNEREGHSRLKGMYRALWGISYDLDANNLFSFEASYINRNSETESQNITRRMMNGSYEQDSEGTIDNSDKSEESNFSFMYTHKFTNNGELSFRTDRLEKQNDGTNLSQFRYTNGDQTAYNNLSDEKHLFYTTRLDYTQRFNKNNGLLKMGVKYTNVSDEQETDYSYLMNNQKENDKSYTDLYNYKEEVYAGYAQYSFKTGRFDFNAGLRIEHAMLSPRSSSNPERNQESTHTDWAPELGLSYAINKEKGHHISLQYGRSVSRPFFSYLNPRIERVNEYSYSMGNPLLEPSATDHYSLRTTLFNKYTLGLTHRYSHDGIIQLPEEVDGVLYTTPQRGLKRSDYSAYVGIPVRLKQWGQLDFSVTYNYTEESYMENHSSDSQYTFTFNGMFMLPKNFSINTEFVHSTPAKSLYGETRSNPIGMVRINKSFLRRSLNVSVMFNDIFNSFGSLKQEFYYNDHSHFSKPTYHGFTFGVNVRYTLRWGKKFMVRRGGSGNMEESIRLETD
ncbi:MAG: outer membrane beta-barrel protein [Bacteroides sp.]|nr:outer membrane beta-barrel protein [Bacteroides sp.]